MNYSSDYLLYSSDTLCAMNYLDMRSLLNDADTLCLPVQFLETVPRSEPITDHVSPHNSGIIVLGHGVLIIVLTVSLDTHHSPPDSEVLSLCGGDNDPHKREVVVLSDVIEAVTAFRLWSCGGGAEAFYQLDLLDGSHSALFHMREASKHAVDEGWRRRAEELIGDPIVTCFREDTDLVESTFAWDRIREEALRRSSAMMNVGPPEGEKGNRHDNSSTAWRSDARCPIQLHEKNGNDALVDGMVYVFKCLLCDALTSYISILHEECTARGSIIQLRFSQLTVATSNAQASGLGDIASMSISLRNGATLLEKSVAQDVITLLGEEEATARMKLSKFLSSRSSAS